jgi:hypothetical protein
MSLIDIEIEKGVPVPKHYTKNKWAALLERMELGDSVVLERKEATKFHQAVATNHREVRILQRRIDETRTRCWKIKREDKNETP